MFLISLFVRSYIYTYSYILDCSRKIFWEISRDMLSRSWPICRAKTFALYCICVTFLYAQSRQLNSTYLIHNWLHWIKFLTATSIEQSFDLQYLLRYLTHTLHLKQLLSNVLITQSRSRMWATNYIQQYVSFRICYDLFLSLVFSIDWPYWPKQLNLLLLLIVKN